MEHANKKQDTSRDPLCSAAVTSVSVPPFGSGRSLDLTLQLANFDPGPSAAGAALVRWAQEFGQATLPAQSRAMPMKDFVRVRAKVTHDKMSK